MKHFFLLFDSSQSSQKKVERRHRKKTIPKFEGFIDFDSVIDKYNIVYYNTMLICCILQSIN